MLNKVLLFLTNAYKGVQEKTRLEDTRIQRAKRFDLIIYEIRFGRICKASVMDVWTDIRVK